jgi:pimeloyl-ACP methyl ester carboxylesterase
MESVVSLCEISSIPYAVLSPQRAGPLPLCIFLLGAGGTRENLIDLQPMFEEWWRERILPPMIVATPSPGMDYYLEDTAGILRWDSFLAAELIPELRANLCASQVTILAGISGGGYGALKLAFAYPRNFAAVAAMQPMLEPGLRVTDAGPRNRLHHVAGGPPQLIGPVRDAAIRSSRRLMSAFYRAMGHSRSLPTFPDVRCNSELAIWI